MSLLENWRNLAYSREVNEKDGGKEFWTPYFIAEKGVYEKFLAEPNKQRKMTLKEFSESYGLDILYSTGFVDGINDSLQNPIKVEKLEENTEIDFALNLELLYKNMVEAKADWLYELPQWENIFSAEKRKSLYLEQKKSNTIINDKKVGRNDQCPCGSGKKYKRCCGL